MLDNANFRQASVSKDEHEEVLTALTKDFRKLMKDDGPSGIAARPDFELKAGRLIRREVENALAYIDPIPLLFQRQTGDLGDTVEFEEVINTMRVVRYTPGSHPSTQTPRKNKYSIQTAMYELAFGINLHKVMVGTHDINVYVQHAAEALARHRMELGFGAIYNATSVGSPTDVHGRALYDTVAAAEVDEATLKDAIRRLKAVSGGQVRIWGTSWALDPIMDFTAGDAEVFTEELHRRGAVGVYRGAGLFEVNADYNPYYGQFPQIEGKDLDSLLFLTVEQPGGIFLERDISALDWQKTDAEKASFRTGTRLDHGTLVHEAWKYHTIEMTG